VAVITAEQFLLSSIDSANLTSFAALINYLVTYYLPWKYEFVTCYINGIRNFGIKATSRVESAHRAIKPFLRNRLSSLNMLYEQIRNACANQKAEFLRRLQNAKQLYLVKYRTDGLLQDLIFRVSPKALALIWIQYRLAFEDWLKEPLGNPFVDCKKAFTTQYGLPCKHFIRNLLRGRR
jgi:hypothetical protein